MSTAAHTHAARQPDAALDFDLLAAIERKVLWLSTAIIDAANSPARKDPDGLKIGGHQASSASMATIMTALWFTDAHQRGPGLGQAARVARCCTRSTTCSAS